MAVFGCGGVGLNTIQAARLVGAGKIMPLTELNHAFDLMLKGEVKRSVVVYE